MSIIFNPLVLPLPMQHAHSLSKHCCNSNAKISNYTLAHCDFRHFEISISNSYFPAKIAQSICLFMFLLRRFQFSPLLIFIAIEIVNWGDKILATIDFYCSKKAIKPKNRLRELKNCLNAHNALISLWIGFFMTTVIFIRCEHERIFQVTY